MPEDAGIESVGQLPFSEPAHYRAEAADPVRQYGKAPFRSITCHCANGQLDAESSLPASRPMGLARSGSQPPDLTEVKNGRTQPLESFPSLPWERSNV
jgi:hypothetical protein